MTCRAAWEGGRFDGVEDERRAHPAPGARAGAEFVDVEWRAGFDDLVAREPGARGRVVGTDFDRHAGRSGRPRARDARHRRRHHQGGRDARRGSATRCRCAAIGARGRRGGDRHGRRGVPSRLLATRFGSRWTYAGQRRGAGADAGGADARRVPLPRGRARRRGSSAWSAGRRMHSLSPVMHNAAFAAAGIDAVYVPLHDRRLRRLPGLRRRDGRRGRQRDDPVQARRAARGDRVRGAWPPRWARPTRCGASAGRLGGHQHRRRRLSRAARGRSFRRALDRRARLGARRRRLGARGGGGAARREGMRVTRARAAGRSRRARSRRRSAARSAPWPPAAGLVGPAGEHARRSAARTGGDESPLPGGPFDGRLVYDLTYGAGDSALVREARRAGLPDARRPADARRAGRAAVRVVDGPAAARPA